MRQMYQLSQIKKTLFVSLFLGIIFILAVAVWYAPVLFKGYAAYTLTANGLLGRNVFLTGLYSTENNLNVILAPSLIKKQGHLAAAGNKLTSLLYAQVFRIIGLPEKNNFVLLSITIHALSLVIFVGLILGLFGFKTASVFSLIYIFLPFNWRLPYALGTYEFALLFFSLFFLFYFYGIRQKHNCLYLTVAGIFLALACLSKEALLLFYLCFFGCLPLGIMLI